MAYSQEHPDKPGKYQIIDEYDDLPYLYPVLKGHMIPREKLIEGFDTYTEASEIAAEINAARIKAEGR